MYRWQIIIWKDAQHHVSLRNCKLKWNTTAYILEWPKFKTLTSPNAAKHLEEQNTHSLLLVGTQNGTITLENSLAVSYKTKHAFISYNLAVSHIYETSCSHKILYTNVHSSFICNSCKLEAANVVFTGWMFKETVAHPHQETPLSLKGMNSWYTQQFGWLSRELW